MSVPAEYAAWPPRDFEGYGEHPPNPKWPNNARICVSFCLNYEEGGEDCVLNPDDKQSEAYLGEIPNRQPKVGERDFIIESEFEYGSRVGVWRLLKLFKKYNVRSTVWLVSKALYVAPSTLIKALKRDQHEIASHGGAWTDYSSRGLRLDQYRAEFGASMLCIADRTQGNYEAVPSGIYIGRLAACHWYSLATSPYMYRHGRSYCSDAYNDDLPFWLAVPPEMARSSLPASGSNADPYSQQTIEALLVIPYTLDNNDMKFCLPNSFSKPDDFYEHLKDSFDCLYEEGKETPKMMSIGLHCRISGKPARARAVEKFLAYITTKKHVWIATREEIAMHWYKHHPFDRKE